MLRLKTFGGLWVENPGTVSGPGPRPRSLALLAMLAAAGPKGVSRDRALGVLWPESDADHARHSLSQTIYSLRRDLGVEVILSTPDLKLDSQQITSDVEDFRQAVRAQNWQGAAALYAGPFANGFYLADAPEFERWSESERAALASDGARAIQRAAKQSADSGNLEEAAEYWRRLTRLEPVNARIALSYMEALATIGDRAAALAHGKAHADLLREEFDAQPSREIVELMSYLRNASNERPIAASRRITQIPAAATATEPASATAPDGIVPTSTMPPPHRPPISARAVWAGAAALTVILVIVLIGWRSTITARTERPVLAVGRVRDLTAGDSAAAGTLLSEMLATSLARITDLQVVANSRMVELTPRGAETSRTRVTDAAHRAGATEVIEGELIPLSGGQLRLQARRVSLDRGLVRSGYRIVGTDRMALFDSVTSLIAAELRVAPPARSLAEVSTSSPVAYRFYEEGLRAFFQFDAASANRLFRAAIHEDSSFAMATYYAWRSAIMTGADDQVALSERAEALASRASPRDRLLILTHVRFTRSDPRAAGAADSLAARYPFDPEVLIRAAEATPELRRATELLDRSIALDSAAIGPSGGGAICRLCDALNLLQERYAWADSQAAVERTLRRWSALRPRDMTPWAALADHFIGIGQRTKADAARRHYETLGGSRGLYLADIQRALLLDDVPAVNAQCEEGLASPDTAAYIQFRWYCTIGLRMQGRYAEALALVREGRIPKSRLVRPGFVDDRVHRAILDMETGRPAAAADEFLELERIDAKVRMPAGIRARHRTWNLTLAATAAIAGGDTARARQLVDIIERTGQQSLYPRDPLLHHFVRGLLLARAQHHDSAVKEYRAAMYSPTFGYTRINYEMARSLMALDRPGEAIAVLQPALRGGIEGSNLYITRTELHELLAQAFDANRQRDSAAAHFAVVERAWRLADPVFRSRYETARRRAALTTASDRSERAQIEVAAVERY